jgi:hypothetical protein
MDLACQEAGIEDGDMSFIPYRIHKRDIVDSPSSSHEDAFFDDLPFGGGDALFVEDEFIEVPYRRSVFIGSGKVLQKILDGGDAVFSKDLDVSGCGFECGFEIRHIVMIWIFFSKTTKSKKIRRTSCRIMYPFTYITYNSGIS